MKVYIPIGIPGCGKSTYYKNNISNVIRLSMDDIRAKICGDISDQSKNNLVYKIYTSQMITHAYDDEDIYLDATNLCPIERTLDMLSEVNPNVNAEVILFDSSKNLNLCMERVHSRKNGSIVPDNVMKDFYSRYCGYQLKNDPRIKSVIHVS